MGGAGGRRDHPRSRGVYAVLGGGCESGQGSSPLARGLRGAGITVQRVVRIIPARAGFTGSSPASPSGSRDHPRSRGVYPMATAAARVSPGSSPLARGLLDILQDLGDERGIIPARAGFTTFYSLSTCLVEDHPRSRGVYTPPRRASALCAWIIPARAGFTSPKSAVSTAAADHPRSRGVYPGASPGRGTTCGSSPLARGLRCGVCRAGADVGIIPARAGFTYAGGESPGTQPDHPRSRGVYAFSMSEANARLGSSPLARGLPTSAVPCLP